MRNKKGRVGQARKQIKSDFIGAKACEVIRIQRTCLKKIVYDEKPEGEGGGG